MARIPEIIRRNAVTDFGANPVPAGTAFRFLADVTRQLADVVKPAAMQEARQAGAESVYRDAEGKLHVSPKSPLGGEWALEHNAAAYGNYMAQQRLDIRQNVSNLAREFQFDPAGFSKAMETYTSSLTETAPAELVPEVLTTARAEGLSVFNGLQTQLTNRDRTAAAQSTQAEFELLADDFISLFAQGSDEEAEKLFSEIEGVLDYRAAMPWITYTDEQRALDLSGLRGRAKAARLAVDIENIGNVNDLPEEERAALEARLKDPDIASGEAQRLGGYARKEFVALDARAFVGDLTSDDFWHRLIGVESGFDPNAKNPNSSASGLFQTIDGTFVEAAKELPWAKGKSKAEILAMRGDGEREREVAEVVRARNQAALQKAGLPINNHTEHMAWFFGAGGATKVLNSDPSTPLVDIVGEKVIDANPFLKGMTTADAARWSRRKMAISSAEAPAMYAAISAIENPELRGRASAELNAWLGNKRAEESAVYQGYLTAAAEGRSPTIEQVLDDENLSPTHRNSLIQTLHLASDDANNTAATAADVMNPAFVWDATSKDHAKRVNKMFDSGYKGGNVMTDPTAGGMARTIVENTGILPKAAFTQMSGAVRSGDPAQIVGAMAYGRNLKDASPNVFTDLGTAGVKFEADMAEFNHYASLGYTAEEIGAAMAISRSPEGKATIKDRKKEAKEIADAFTLGDLLDTFDTGIFSNPDLIPVPEKQAAILSDYRDILEREFIEAGDPAAAKARATEIFQRQWSASTVLGGERIVQFPPEKHYPPANAEDPNDPIGYFREQLVRDVTAEARGEDVAAQLDIPKSGAVSALDKTIAALSPFAPGDGPARPIPPNNIFLIGDEQTRKEALAPNVYPSYLVYYLDPETGNIEQMKNRFFADPTQALAKAKNAVDNPSTLSFGMVSGPDDEEPSFTFRRN